MKVLVVDPDSSRAAGVADALAAGGAQTAMAPSASFALTMLEWNRQEVIVSRAQVGDMDGRELCAILRADPSMKAIRFVLVANDVTPAQSAELGIDLVIPDGLIGQAIATRVIHLMRRESEATTPPAPAPQSSTPRVTVRSPTVAQAPAEVPPLVPPVPTVLASPAPAPTAPPPAAAPSAAPAPTVARGAAPPPPPLTELESVGLNGAMRTFQGALGSLDLQALAQAIATGGKTGRLLLVLPTGGGMIAFDSGRIVHAELGNTTGETAFQSLLSASHRDRGGKFCFIPSDPRDLTNVPRTITRTVSQLLEAAAKPTDEER